MHDVSNGVGGGMRSGGREVDVCLCLLHEGCGERLAVLVVSSSKHELCGRNWERR